MLNKARFSDGSFGVSMHDCQRIVCAHIMECVCEIAVTLAKLDLKVYLLIRYIAATWLTEKELSEIESELDIFHKDS